MWYRSEPASPAPPAALQETPCLEKEVCIVYTLIHVAPQSTVWWNVFMVFLHNRAAKLFKKDVIQKPFLKGAEWRLFQRRSIF